MFGGHCSSSEMIQIFIRAIFTYDISDRFTIHCHLNVYVKLVIFYN